MHIEPGVVDGAKQILGWATGAGALAYAGRAWMRAEGGGRLARTAVGVAAVFGFFQVLPHVPVGVSEVHLILGSTLFLLLGAGPAAIGLAAGLLVQGLFFAPADLPQFGMNVTTLLVPLFALQAVAARLVPAGTPYTDLRYADVARLSLAYQGGIVAWVAFWAFWGQGFGVASSVASFGAAYVVVLAIEPLVDLAVLAAAKGARAGWLNPRLAAA